MIMMSIDVRAVTDEDIPINKGGIDHINVIKFKGK